MFWYFISQPLDIFENMRRIVTRITTTIVQLG